MEGLDPVVPLPRPRATARARSWIRDRLTTTPGKLVLLSLLLVAVAVGFAAIAGLAERSRAHAAQAVATQTEPLLLQSVFLYTALSDANATATATFLSGGLEPPARRHHYLGDLQIASDSLATLTRELGSSATTGSAVRTISEQLPVYSGLVEAARANNRQGFPVGAAYLRQASGLLTGTILPQANRIFATEAGRLRDNYRTGTATPAIVVFAIAAVLALGLLALAQRHVARVSRRIFNLPMLIGAAVLAGLSIWALTGLTSEQNALARAQRNSDAVEVLSASRVLLSRAQTDQSLILANRGSDQTHPPDFAAVMRALAPTGGLLGEVPKVAEPTAPAQLDAEFQAYQTEAARISDLAKNGQIGKATGLGSSSPQAAGLDADLSAQSTVAQQRFASAADDATTSLSGLSIALPVLALVAGVLAIFGVRQRLGEYR